VQLFAWGATACLATDSDAGEIHRAVRMAASGQQMFVAAVRVANREARFGGIASLTSREREVLALLACGHSNSEIALRLYISIETARTHAASIYRKLGVRSRGELYGIEIPPRSEIQGALNA
jgi:DNA-binding NarL/FixJ family response regulator